MNNVVHMFFNYSAREKFPAVDYWANWDNPDTTKLAIFVEHSWRKRNWHVKRMTTHGIDGFNFSGQCVESLKLYPIEFWNFWFAACTICRKYGPTLFSTIDVLNNGFWPDDAYFAWLSRPFLGDVQAFRKGFSAATVMLDGQACCKAIDTIQRYDKGEFKRIESNLVSDETILRHYGHYYERDYMSYALIESDKQLIHCPRSVIKNYHSPDNQ